MSAIRGNVAVECQRASIFDFSASLFFGLLSLLIPSLSFSALPPRTGSSEQTLSCEQSLKIAQWAILHAKHRDSVELSSAEFRRNAIKNILLKLDPHKLLYSQEDLKDLQKSGGEWWSSWVSEKKCDGFIEWIRESRVSAKARFYQRVENLNLPLLESKNTFKGSNLLPPVFSEFAKGNAELISRTEKYAAAIFRSASPKIREAYTGMLKELINQSFGEMLFDFQPQPEVILSKAVLAALDPYSTYFSKEEFQEFYEDLTGGLSGIGVHVRRVPRGLFVEKLVPQSPAEKSKKISVGDTITSVDGINLSKLPAKASKRLLKGSEGSKVALEILPSAGKKTTKLELTRRHFVFEESQLNATSLKTPQGTIALFSIPSFYGRGGAQSYQDERSVAEDFREIFQTKLRESPKLVVLDLRGNPGGYLEEAVSIGSYFLGDRPIVKVVDTEHSKVLKGDETPLFLGPLLILVDEGTASAAEVLTGALADYKRAVVVGTSRTYGKGSVQKIFNLEDGVIQSLLDFSKTPGVLKITTSLFYSPLGHTPANGGIDPDILLPKITQEEKQSTVTPSGSLDVKEEQALITASNQSSPATLSDKLVDTLEDLSEKRTEERRLKRDSKIALSELRSFDATDSAWQLEECVAIGKDLLRLHKPQIAAR